MRIIIFLIFILLNSCKINKDYPIIITDYKIDKRTNDLIVYIKNNTNINHYIIGLHTGYFDEGGISFYEEKRYNQIKLTNKINGKIIEFMKKENRFSEGDEDDMKNIHIYLLPKNKITQIKFNTHSKKKIRKKDIYFAFNNNGASFLTKHYIKFKNELKYGDYELYHDEIEIKNNNNDEIDKKLITL